MATENDLTLEESLTVSECPDADIWAFYRRR